MILQVNFFFFKVTFLSYLNYLNLKSTKNKGNYHFISLEDLLNAGVKENIGDFTTFVFGIETYIL